MKINNMILLALGTVMLLTSCKNKDNGEPVNRRRNKKAT